MVKGDTVKIEITNKGAIRIHHAYIYDGTIEGRVIAVGVDMKSQYGQILATGVDAQGRPSIIVGSVETSQFLSNKHHRDEPTDILFPELAGWTIWCSHMSKSTIHICFVKN